MATSDAETLLIQQVRSGDASAWQLMIERYEGRLLAFVDSRLRDRAASEDVVQETLFRAWRKPAVLAQKDASARGWLFTVARNIVVDDWRSSQRRPTTYSELLPELLEPDGADTAVQSLMVAEALRRLTRDHRAVLLECYFRGCTAAQAAGRLGVPVGTVKSRLHYALHALRLIFEEMGVVT